MSSEVYEVVAYTMRYWFLLLIAVIIWRSIRWLRKDGRRSAKVRRALPDAGFVGEWVVLSSQGSRVKPGEVFPVSRDGWLGSARICDVFLRDRGVPARAARFFLKKDGLHLLPQKRDTLLVDGEWVSREAVLRHGATLEVGGVALQLRMFAGILLTGETPAPVLRQPDPAPAADPQTSPDASLRLPTPTLRLAFDREKHKGDRRRRET